MHEDDVFITSYEGNINLCFTRFHHLTLISHATYAHEGIKLYWLTMALINVCIKLLLDFRLVCVAHGRPRKWRENGENEENERDHGALQSL